MNKHVAMSTTQAKLFRIVAFVLIVALAALIQMVAIPNPAKANTTVDLGGSSPTELDFSSSKRAPATAVKTTGAVHVYTNVATVGNIQIDARVTTTLSNATITDYDTANNAAPAMEKYFQADNSVSVAGGYSSFKFEFFDHADGSPAVLKNVKVTSIDLDNPGRQYTQFSGFQQYFFASSASGGSSNLSAYTTDQANSALGNGLVRFTPTRPTAAGSHSNIAEDAVETDFAELSSYVAVFGNEEAQAGRFGIAFKGLCDVVNAPCTLGVARTNPNNNPPTSVSSTRYYDLSVPATLFLNNFPYTDIDGNAFRSVKITSLPSTGTLEYFNGTSWVSVTVGTVITAADISLGYLRYTGTGSSFGYSVNDGLVDSTSNYTLTLVGAANGQTINFVNPGNKTPTAPTFDSGATATSGLTVILTSLTPSTCVVSGLTIDPVGVGACTIVASQPGNSNYGAAPSVTQTFYITTDAPQTITLANPGDQSWPGSSFPIPSTPSATSSLTVTLTSFSPSVCTISGTTITIVGPGTCQIRGTQGGGVNGGTTYAAAPPVTISFIVSATSNYTLTYDGNTSTEGTAPAVTTGNGGVTLRANTGNLVKSGYSFNGWNTEADGNGTHYATLGHYILSADVTLYAEWASTVYTLTYNSNSSTSGNVPDSMTGINDVSLATNSGSLVRTGYRFLGWNTEADGNGTHYDVDADFNLTADTTLYAEWEHVYTITYNGNSNTSGSSPDDQVDVGSVNLASTSGTLVRTGYSFSGWNSSADGARTHYELSASYNLTADITLYAQWTLIIYTITYDGNSSTSGIVPDSMTGINDVSLATNSGSLVRTGYRFLGWNTEADGNGTHYDVDADFNLTADTTLYAEWEHVYTITYNGNTSTGGSVPISISGYGNKALSSTSGTLVKTGYIFKGWNTQADGRGTHFRLSAAYNLLADVTLYAEWEVLPAIIYEANGATSGDTPADIPAGSPITIDPNTGNLVRAGFRFLGWNTQPNGGGTHYRAGMTPVLPVGTTLYAEWQPISTTLASTGSDVAPVLPLAFGMMALGVALITRRKRLGKHRAIS